MKKATLLTAFILSSFIGFCQNAESTIKDLQQKLESGKMTITEILTEESLLSLHQETAFRNMIKANAKAEKITLVGKNEPGIRITVKGQVLKNGLPSKNTTVYVYHTSDKGWYSDSGVHISGNEGDYRHARLFGYFKTDVNGKFSFITIKPKGYPKSDLAAHIHIQLWDENGQPLHGTGELQFDDDPRMTPERRKRSLEEGFLISKNSGTTDNPVYAYQITCD